MTVWDYNDLNTPTCEKAKKQMNSRRPSNFSKTPRCHMPLPVQRTSRPLAKMFFYMQKPHCWHLWQVSHLLCRTNSVSCSMGLMQVSETNKVIISDTYCWPSSEGSEATWPTCRRWQQTRRWPMGQSNRTGKVCPLPHTAPRPGSLDGKVPGVKWIGKHETHSQILMVFHA